MKQKMVGITTKWHCLNTMHKNSRTIRNALLLQLFEPPNVTLHYTKRSLHSDGEKTFNGPNNAVNAETEAIIRQARAQVRTRQGKKSEKPKIIALNRKISVPRELTLVKEEGAKVLASLIGNDIAKNPKFVVDLTPGKGLLAAELLKLDIPEIHLFERPNNCDNELYDLVGKHHKRLILKEVDFKRFSKIHYQDLKTGENKLRQILDGIEEREWEDDCYIQFIRITTEFNLLKHLTMSVIFQNSLMAYGRPCFYFIILPSLWNDSESTGPWTNILSAMFNILFDVKVFGTVDRNHFLPQPKNIPEPCPEQYTKIGHRLAKIKYNNEQYLRVVKVEPKRNLFKDYIGEDDLLPLWLFIRNSLRKKHTRVIPQMEQYAPSCTLKLITMDYTYFTEFRDLSILQLLELFKEFRTWPEYENTTFVSAVDNMIKDVQNNYLKCTESDCFGENPNRSERS